MALAFVYTYLFIGLIFSLLFSFLIHNQHYLNYLNENKRIFYEIYTKEISVYIIFLWPMVFFG